jgi:hypothetical protein
MRPILVFGAASLSVFWLVCATTVFGLGQYDRAWDRWGSFQVEAWVSLVGALVATGAFGIASTFMHRTHYQGAALALGVGCSAIFVALCLVLNSTELTSNAYIAFALLIGLSCVAAYAGQRVGS